MSFFAIPFPVIDPVAISVGPVDIRWYGLSYLAAFVVVWYFLRKAARSEKFSLFTVQQADDIVFYTAIGVVLGGRLGYVFFYKPFEFLSNPLHIFAVWEGGMSFHGGFIGALLGTYFFCRKNKASFLSIMDLGIVYAPIGLFFGRIANFINGELYGRASDVPWAMIFPHGGPNPRHPSQLYEAFLEGLVLFIILYCLWHFTRLRERKGAILGAFCIGYASFRFIVEFFREPDEHLGFIFQFLTMGQILCLPLLFIGLFFLFRPFAKKHNVTPRNHQKT